MTTSAAALLIMASCGGGDGATKTGGGAMPAMPVVVEKVQTRNVPVRQELVARTKASGTIEIRPNVSGQLVEKSFQEGTSVQKGQILYRIDPRRYEANVLSAKAALEKAEAALELARTQENLVNAQAALKQAEATLQKNVQDVARLRPLATERAVPERDLDAAVAAENVARAQYESAQATLRTTSVSDRARIRDAEANVENARAVLSKAQLDLDDTVIRSPLNGIIGRSELSVGNFVTAAQTLLATISSVNPINVEFQLPEADYLRLARQRQAGNRPTGDIELVLSDNSVFPNPGRFTVAERAVDERTGTIVLQAEFPNPSGIVRPGQFGRVRFTAEERPNALLVSEKALMEIQGSQVVYIVDEGNKIALRSVVTDGAVDGYAIVTSGLQGNEQVVVEGQVKVRPGAPVTIVPARKD